MTRRAALATILGSLVGAIMAAFHPAAAVEKAAHDPTPTRTSDAEYIASLRAVIQPMPGGIRLGKPK